MLCVYIFFDPLVCFTRLWNDRKCVDLHELSDLSAKLAANRSIERSPLPLIYLITPTYSRAVQKAELTRLSYTFAHVENVNWIIVEDSINKTDVVSKFIEHTSKLFPNLVITHLNAATPDSYKIKQKEPSWLKPRGVLQRNQALQWIRDYYRHRPSLKINGVVYFADDDNTYDLQLFDEMRYTNKVSVWPVGLVGGLLVERPIIGKIGKIIGWNTLWRPDRPFAIDMAGFAVNLTLIINKPNAKFTLTVPRGFQESSLLKQLIKSVQELEPKATNCTKVYVWHTRTEIPKLKQEVRLKVPSDKGVER